MPAATAGKAMQANVAISPAASLIAGMPSIRAMAALRRLRRRCKIIAAADRAAINKIIATAEYHVCSAVAQAAKRKAASPSKTASSKVPAGRRMADFAKMFPRTMNSPILIYDITRKVSRAKMGCASKWFILYAPTLYL
jgi:hypothetical protein